MNSTRQEIIDQGFPVQCLHTPTGVVVLMEGINDDSFEGTVIKSEDRNPPSASHTKGRHSLTWATSCWVML